MFSAYFCVSVLALTNVICALKQSRPQVFVVTPASSSKAETGRSAPFYYHSWLRRMDTARNDTKTTTTTTPKTKTPDLIFAEFESDEGSDMKKSIRKLLENERVQSKTSTAKPIYVADETENHTEEKSQDGEDYFAMYNSMYNNPSAPVYMPSTTVRSTTTTTTQAPVDNRLDVKNIWHIIDNEKQNTYSDDWHEVSIDENSKSHETERVADSKSIKNNNNFNDIHNIASSTENESRGIRTEPKLNFPYVNLKTVQMKNQKKSNSKNSNNMYMNLDNFQAISNPVRGEAEDVYKTNLQPIDRYNPAQPHLPMEYGSQSKKVNPSPASTKTYASLVPPPPPSPPAASDSLPPPKIYESFPPYPSADDGSDFPPPTAEGPPPPSYQAPYDDSDLPPNAIPDSGPAMDLGYKYKQAKPAFLPTLPPLSKPVDGYAYQKPTMDYAAPAAAGGYSYDKPVPSPMAPAKPSYPGYSYDKPSVSFPAIGYEPHHDADIGMRPPAIDDVKPDITFDTGFPQDFPGDLKYHHDFEDHDFYHHHHHHPTTTEAPTTEMPRVNRYSYYYLGKKLYYLPLYFSVYFIVYVGALIIKAVLRHKIVYPNSWRPNDQTASFFAKRSADNSWSMSGESMHELTGFVTKAIANAAEKYMEKKKIL